MNKDTTAQHICLHVLWRQYVVEEIVVNPVPCDQWVALVRIYIKMLDMLPHPVVPR